MTRPLRMLPALAAAAIAAMPSFAHAVVAQRTFVASNGSDANACSLAAPCRSFAAAIAQTSAGGEVVALDSAGYGPVTITSSITLTAPAGIYAGITVLAPGGFGVGISAGAGDTVVLRGLTINNLAAGQPTGILATSAGEIVVDRCVVNGFNIGLWKGGSAATRVLVRDSAFLRNGLAVYFDGSAGNATLTVDRSQIEGGTSGIDLHGHLRAAVTDSVIEGTAYGIWTFASVDLALVVDRVRIVAPDALLVDTIGAPAANTVASVGVSHAAFRGNVEIQPKGGYMHVSVASSTLQGDGANPLVNVMPAAGALADLNVAESTLVAGSVGVNGAPASGGTARITIARTAIMDNSGDGIHAGAGSDFALRDNTITYNGGGGVIRSGGTVKSFGNTLVDTNGVTSSTPTAYVSGY